MLYDEYLTKKRPYQELAEEFLLQEPHSCLYFKPGKGKTFPCITAINEIDKMMNGNANVLILSTADSIKKMWLSEIQPQGILPEHTFMITFNSAIVEKTKAQLLKIKWDVLIVDECHKVKSHNSKTSKLVFSLSKKTKYVWGLSGTPRGNTDVDIFCQFHNLCIADWGNIPYTRFVERCCDLDIKHFNGQVIKVPTGIKKEYLPGWERNISMYTMRVDYDEADEMPDLKVEEIKLPYKPTKEYLQAEDGIIKLSEYENTMTKLTAIQKCHQAVNGFLYYPINEFENGVYHIERNKKLDWLKNNLTNEPTVIVYRHTEDYNQLKNEFQDSTEDIDDFKNGKSNILLLQCSRCESFNLPMCKRMIFYTLDYSYIKYNQMLHRVWRMGQTQDVKIQILLFDKTVENKIWNAVKNKEKLADLFMAIKGV